MAKEKVKDIVARLAEPIVDSLGLELVDTEYVKEGKDWFVRVYIYKKDGVSIDDCVDVTHKLNERLDEEDPIVNPYVLEVSSPGIDKPFRTDKDYERYQGELIEVHLYNPLHGVKEFEGTLIGLVNHRIVIKNDSDEQMEFAKEEVSTVKRIVKF